MPNHFHFLIKIKENEKPEKIADYPKVPNVKTLTPLEKAFRDFFICYSKSINKAQNRTGALFQARFKRKCITKDTYLIRIIPYIHLNPVRSGLCSKPDEWKFSSYNSIISDKETKIKRIEILKWFNDIESFIKIHKEYREYQKERDYLFKNS